MDDIADGALAVLVQVISAAAVAVASHKLREAEQNELTVTRLDFDAMLNAPQFNGWFCSNLRCSQYNFKIVCLLFRPFASAMLLNGTEHSFEKKMALTLYYLASSGSIHEAGNAMGISKPCAAKTINEMLRVICSRSAAHIKLPSTDSEWGEVMKGFQEGRGFPFVCGAIDGSLFEIARPADYEGWYCKDFYPAINMQAVCDAKRRFLDYDMRPGSYSDKKLGVCRN